MFLLAAIPPHAKIRAILLVIAFIPVVFAHIIISLHTKANKTNKTFFFLSLLWCTKLIVYVMNEGINLFFQKELLFLGWIDLFLLLIISLLVSLSFIIKNPFFYIRTDKNIYKAFGILALIFSGWITLQIIFVFIDYVNMPGR
jgi:hypothetical protein